ncbi:hypothetical protein Bca4012_005717 [Brassica carinata]
MSQSSLIVRKGGPSNATCGQTNTEDDIIRIPDCDLNYAKERFRLTLIGRVFHLRGCSIDALINLLPRPRIWNVEGRVQGLNLGNGRFQFDFDNEVDLQTVLNKRPCHFNQWSFTLERWEPFTSENFPNTIPFWINVTGVPVHFWNDKTFMEIANALGKKLLIDDKKTRIQVSIDANKPLQFERIIGFPNGDIGKVSLLNDGLHRYCFTCKLISHDENTCPQLTPEEREIKRKHRAENHAINDNQRPLIQGTQGHNSGNSLKRPRSPIYGRHHSPQSFSKDDELYRNDKRRKNFPSKDSKDTRGNGYQTRDHISSGRLDNRHSHSNKEVWSRLEIPNEREHQQRGNRDHHHSQSNSRHRSLYQAPQHKKSSTMEWRQRSCNDTKRARAPPSRDARHAPYARSERSRVTYDSQRTISDNHVSLESGEMVVNRETDEAKPLPPAPPRQKTSRHILLQQHPEAPPWLSRRNPWKRLYPNPQNAKGMSLLTRIREISCMRFSLA